MSRAVMTARVAALSDEGATDAQIAEALGVSIGYVQRVQDDLAGVPAVMPDPPAPARAQAPAAITRPVFAIQHGTFGGYGSHKRRGQPPCEACAEAARAYWATKRVRSGKAPRPTAEHGTHGGYRAHRRRGEAACDPCLEAARAFWRTRKPKGQRSETA